MTTGRDAVREKSRLAEWLAVDSLRDFFDLALKIFAVLAALFAAQFFLLRPDVEIEVVSVSQEIRVEGVMASFAERGDVVPPVVLDTIELFNELPPEQTLEPSFDLNLVQVQDAQPLGLLDVIEEVLPTSTSSTTSSSTPADTSTTVPDTTIPVTTVAEGGEPVAPEEGAEAAEEGAVAAQEGAEEAEEGAEEAEEGAEEAEEGAVAAQEEAKAAAEEARALAAEVAEASERMPSPRGSITDDVDYVKACEQWQAALINVYDDFLICEFPATLPIYAAIIASRDLDVGLEVEQILEDIEANRFTRVSIRMRNNGDGSAKGIQISPPDELTASNAAPFPLRPGGIRAREFLSDDGQPLMTVSLSDFDWEGEEVAPVNRSLVGIAIAIIGVILLAALVASWQKFKPAGAGRDREK